LVCAARAIMTPEMPGMAQARAMSSPSKLPVVDKHLDAARDVRRDGAPVVPVARDARALVLGRARGSGSGVQANCGGSGDRVSRSGGGGDRA
jgi:hypothetical protein